ncbi:MAG TPA: hypothetical protein V6D08_18870 [Candidatus Obscuribacterales bacterium]
MRAVFQRELSSDDGVQLDLFCGLGKPHDTAKVVVVGQSQSAQPYSLRS